MFSRVCVFAVFYLTLWNLQQPACVHGGMVMPAIRLVNGRATIPNEGQVEIWDPDTSQWATVCDWYWNFYDVQVACRELGYPGAALIKKDSFYGEGRFNWTIGEFFCDGTESNLLSCRNGGFSDKPCTSGTAGAVCTAPGYVGCYRDWYSNNRYDVLRGDYKREPDSLSVEKCLKICRNYSYAGVEYGDECYCGNKVFSYTDSDDRECDDECSGNNEQTCGGHNYRHISVYDVQSGRCDDPGVPTNGNYTVLQATSKVPFYFGTIIEFRCDDVPEFELEGVQTIQCLLASNGNNSVAWSGPVPLCKGKTTTVANSAIDMFTETTRQQESDTPKDKLVNAGAVAGSVVAVLVCIAVALFCLVLWKRRGKRKPTRRESVLHGRAVGSLVAAVNPTYMDAIPVGQPIYSQVGNTKRNVTHYENLPKACSSDTNGTKSEPQEGATSEPKEGAAADVEGASRSEKEVNLYETTKGVESADSCERERGDGQSAEGTEGWVENTIYESSSL